jgi:hypothetical protein
MLFMKSLSEVLTYFAGASAAGLWSLELFAFRTHFKGTHE